MRNYFTKFGVTIALVAVALSPLGHGQNAEKAEKAEAVQGGSLEEQMVGYWAPDPKQMLDIIMKEVGDDPNAQAMIPMIEAMLASMTVEVKKGEVSMHGMGEAQKSTYKITKVDDSTKTLTMMVKEGENDAEEGTATIDGDKLTLAKDGEKIVLNRIDKAEFAKRKAAGQKPPGLPVPQ